MSQRIQNSGQRIHARFACHYSSFGSIYRAACIAMVGLALAFSSFGTIASAQEKSSGESAFEHGSLPADMKTGRYRALQNPENGILYHLGDSVSLIRPWGPIEDAFDNVIIEVDDQDQRFIVSIYLFYNNGISVYLFQPMDGGTAFVQVRKLDPVFTPELFDGDDIFQQASQTLKTVGEREIRRRLNGLATSNGRDLIVDDYDSLFNLYQSFISPDATLLNTDRKSDYPGSLIANPDQTTIGMPDRESFRVQFPNGDEMNVVIGKPQTSSQDNPFTKRD